MNKTLLSAAAAAVAALALGACEEQTSNPPSTTVTPPRAPDNSGKNTRDQRDQTLTPADQSGSEGDRKITAEIRRAIMDEKGMSVDAQNCKIITIDGVVTLRGPVATQAEKDTIEARARSVAGVTGVDNQLEVKNP